MKQEESTETPSRFLVVFDIKDKKRPYGYMETQWTNDELKFRWGVLSEHKTKEEARIEFEAKYGSKVNP